jgi:hypothetical protein
MKKMQFVLVALALLAMLTSIAAAPLASSAISLVDVRNDPGGGVIFIFNVNGQFSKSELKGFVQVQGADAGYDLYCTQKDDTTVHCTTSRKTGGEKVIVTFGGTTFFAFVPEGVVEVVPSQFCYNVYEWLPAITRTNNYTLQAFTTHCQDTRANYGDKINLMSLNNSIYYDHVFMSQCATKIEDAYYLCAD